MDEQWLREQLKARDRAVRPNDHFSALLYARLADELRLRPTHDGKDRPSVFSIKRWLPAVALALLTVGTLAAIAFLARPDDRAFACTPEVIADVRIALENVAGYEYEVTGTIDPPWYDTINELAATGAYAAPSSVHERYEARQDGVAVSATEGKRVGDQVWTLPLFPDLPPEATPPTAWIPGAPPRVSVDLPNLLSLSANPALFALDGLLAQPPPFDWTVSESETCELAVRHVWSERNGAEQMVSVAVDPETRLPTSIRNVATGFTHNAEARAWDILHTFDYGSVPTITAPAADEVRPSPDFGGWTPGPRQIIERQGSATFEGLRVTASDVAEVREFEGSTPIPGNVYLQVKLRYEALEGTRPVVGAGDWQAVVEGLAPGGEPAPPYHVEGGPEMLQSDLRFNAGDVMEGWLVLEVPMTGDVSIFGFGSQGWADAPIEIVLR